MEVAAPPPAVVSVAPTDGVSLLLPPLPPTSSTTTVDAVAAARNSKSRDAPDPSQLEDDEDEGEGEEEEDDDEEQEEEGDEPQHAMSIGGATDLGSTNAVRQSFAQMPSLEPGTTGSDTTPAATTGVNATVPYSTLSATTDGVQPVGQYAPYQRSRARRMESMNPARKVLEEAALREIGFEVVPCDDNDFDNLHEETMLDNMDALRTWLRKMILVQPIKRKMQTEKNEFTGAALVQILSTIYACNCGCIKYGQKLKCVQHIISKHVARGASGEKRPRLTSQGSIRRRSGSDYGRGDFDYGHPNGPDFPSTFRCPIAGCDYELTTPQPNPQIMQAHLQQHANTEPLAVVRALNAVTGREIPVDASTVTQADANAAVSSLVNHQMRMYSQARHQHWSTTRYVPRGPVQTPSMPLTASHPSPPVPLQSSQQHQQQAQMKSQGREEIPTACDNCGKTDVELMQCSACMSAFYCSPECQKVGWKMHRAVCKEKKAQAKAADVTATKKEPTTAQANGAVVKKEPMAEAASIISASAPAVTSPTIAAAGPANAPNHTEATPSSSTAAAAAISSPAVAPVVPVPASFPSLAVPIVPPVGPPVMLAISSHELYQLNQELQFFRTQAAQLPAWRHLFGAETPQEAAMLHAKQLADAKEEARKEVVREMKQKLASSADELLGVQKKPRRPYGTGPRSQAAQAARAAAAAAAAAAVAGGAPVVGGDSSVAGAASPHINPMLPITLGPSAAATTPTSVAVAPAALTLSAAPTEPLRDVPPSQLSPEEYAAAVAAHIQASNPNAAQLLSRLDFIPPQVQVHMMAAVQAAHARAATSVSQRSTDSHHEHDVDDQDEDMEDGADDSARSESKEDRDQSEADAEESAAETRSPVQRKRGRPSQTEAPPGTQKAEGEDEEEKHRSQDAGDGDAVTGSAARKSKRQRVPKHFDE